ncbi:hypothetical protein J6590_045804 [Homalodisca vitripennis]|nr:hypothetical protein J6590_045804 [Homalodisca vitripennis]
MKDKEPVLNFKMYFCCLVVTAQDGVASVVWWLYLEMTGAVPAALVPQIFLCSYRNFTKFDSGRVEGTNVMLHSRDKKEEEQNRASLKCIIDTTIFCGENEIPSGTLGH